MLQSIRHAAVFFFFWVIIHFFFVLHSHYYVQQLVVFKVFKRRHQVLSWALRSRARHKVDGSESTKCCSWLFLHSWKHIHAFFWRLLVKLLTDSAHTELRSLDSSGFSLSKSILYSIIIPLCWRSKQKQHTKPFTLVENHTRLIISSAFKSLLFFIIHKTQLSRLNCREEHNSTATVRKILPNIENLRTRQCLMSPWLPRGYPSPSKRQMSSSILKVCVHLSAFRRWPKRNPDVARKRRWV